MRKLPPTLPNTRTIRTAPKRNCKRTLTFELAMKTMPSLWPQITNKIYNALHGKDVQVILDEEPSHYFYGRVTVESAARSQIAGQVVLSVDCEPYRYEIQETSVTFTGTGGR